MLHLMACNNPKEKNNYLFRAIDNSESGLDFTNKVGAIAEQADHHPDIQLGWGYCVVQFSTHSIGGLHANDFILAKQVDAL